MELCYLWTLEGLHIKLCFSSLVCWASLGFAEIAPGGDLILHYHSPAEIYVITEGNGTLNKSGELQEVRKGDVVYIAKNAKHALKNNGEETLKFYWIFPTDRFSEVEYLY